jgi:hypothetical protein
VATRAKQQTNLSTKISVFFLKLPLDRRDSSSSLSVLGLLTAGMEKLLGPKLREEDGMRVDNSALDRPVPDGSLTQLPRVTNTLSD